MTFSSVALKLTFSFCPRRRQFSSVWVASEAEDGSPPSRSSSRGAPLIFSPLDLLPHPRLLAQAVERPCHARRSTPPACWRCLPPASYQAAPPAAGVDPASIEQTRLGPESVLNHLLRHLRRPDKRSVPVELAVGVTDDYGVVVDAFLSLDREHRTLSSQPRRSCRCVAEDFLQGQ